MKRFITVIVGIMIIQWVNAAEQSNTAAIGKWNFDQADIQTTKKAEDNSGNNHSANLIRFGEQTKLVSGRHGTAIHFPKNDESKRDIFGGLRIKNPGISFTKPFTVEMWVKFDKEGKFAKFQDIFGNAKADRGPGFRLTSFYGSIIFRSGDGKAYWDCKTNSSKTIITHDKWIFLAITFDGKKASIFMDGIKVAEKSMKITSGQKDIYVGSYCYGYAYPMVGAIDEIKIYDRAKTTLEISAEYLKSKN